MKVRKNYTDFDNVHDTIMYLRMLKDVCRDKNVVEKVEKGYKNFYAVRVCL